MLQKILIKQLSVIIKKYKQISSKNQMNMPKGYTGSYENDDISDKSMKKYFESKEQKKVNIPVKQNLKNLENFFSDLKKDLDENIKSGQILKSENAMLEHNKKEKCNSITKNLMEDSYNFNKEFKKVKSDDISNTDFLKKQVNSLIMNKTNIDKSRILLEAKLSKCKEEIGIHIQK